LSAPNAAPAWPVEIRLTKDRRALQVSFDDGSAFDLSAELLRVTSPSAEVQGHSEAQRKTVGGKRNVTILSVDPVGNYAVKIGFEKILPCSSDLYHLAGYATRHDRSARAVARPWRAGACIVDFI
jgi:DUF971 family protein